MGAHKIIAIVAIFVVLSNRPHYSPTPVTRLPWADDFARRRNVLHPYLGGKEGTPCRGRGAFYRYWSHENRRTKGGRLETASMVSTRSPAKLSHQALSSILSASSHGQKANR